MNGTSIEKKERVNNWIRRNFNFSTIMAVVLLAGIIFTFISNVKSIPLLKTEIHINKECISTNDKGVEVNSKDVALLQRDIQYIREGIAEIKQMIKESRRN